MAIRPIYLLLIAAAGLLAGAAGWLFGSDLLPGASASLTPPEREVAATPFPAPNRDVKADRVAAKTLQGLPDADTRQVYETARSYFLFTPRPVPIAKPEKPSRQLLTDMQIAGLHKRLNLTPAQEKFWQPVESAMREVNLQFDDYQKRVRKSRDASFDGDSAAIARLKAATRTFYAQLNGEQKNTITLLMRMAGLGQVFAQITNTRAAVEKDD